MKNFFKRYFFNKGCLFLSVLVIIISCICFFISSYNINHTKVSDNPSLENRLVLFETLKDASIVLGSTFGVNLLLGLCIERKNQNKAFEEFFQYDVIKTREFYSRLSEEDKEKMLEGLELDYYYDGNIALREMCKTSREKILSVKDKYYYDNCEYRVTVTDKGDYFEKDIVHNISVMSYEEKAAISSFRLANVTNNKIDGLDVCELTSITHNGKEILSECKKDEKELKSVSSKQAANKQTSILFNKKLHLSNKKAQHFVIRFTTRCPKTDITCSFRASVPCKRFSVNYDVSSNDTNNYTLVTHTFGCCENAEDFSTAKHPSHASVTFENLILKDDGVVVVMCKK